MFIKKTGDITMTEADVIVNAANTQLIHGGGVALAIAQAAGESVEAESKTVGNCRLGDFAVTGAGNLKAKKIIHIPTVDYTRDGGKITFGQLEIAWRRALEYCQKQGYKTIATPLLGAGVVGLDSERVENTLQRVAEKFPELQIILVLRQ